MSIRTKTISVLILTSCLFVLGIIVALRSTFLDSFLELERIAVERNVRQSQNTIHEDGAELGRLTRDWASWDDTYEFMGGENDEYISDNMMDTVFGNLKLSGLLIYDTEGRLKYGKWFDVSSNKEVPLPFSDMLGLQPGHPILSILVGDPTSGIARIGNRLSLVGAYPIRTTSGEGPTRGVLMMLKAIDDDYSAALSARLKTDVSIHELGSLLGETEPSIGATQLADRINVSPIDEKQISGTIALRDIEGHPVAALTLRVGREVYEQAKDTLKMFLIIMIIFSIVFITTVALLWERMVVSRLATVAVDVIRIREEGTLHERIRADGSDDISTLAIAINQMLETLEKSKQLEMKRARDEQTIELFSELPSMAYIKDGDARYVFANASLCDALGRSLHEIIGRNDYEFFPKKVADNFAAADATAIKSCGVYEVELQLPLRAGDTPVALTVIPRNTSRGITEGTVGVMYDLTERESLEAQLRHHQLMDAVGQLAGGVAHEFNNLLQVIAGYIEFSRDSMDPSSAAYDDLGQAQAACNRAASVVKQLLLMGREHKAHRILANVDDILKLSVDFVYPLIGEAIKLDVDYDAGTVSVMADQRLIEQIIINLCINSRDAMPSGGRLRISTSIEQVDVVPGQFNWATPGRFVVIIVKDNGTGMDSSVLEHLFEPFYTTKPVGSGSGLGLSIVYGIVKQHLGFIAVSSEIDQGTTFRIYLPVDSGLSAGQQTETKAVRPAAERRAGVAAIAEDDRAVLEQVSRSCQRLGFDVVCAESGRELIDLIARMDKLPRIVICDVQMPETTGLEVYQHLRRSYPKIPFIFITGYANTEELEDIVRVDGEVIVLQKPFSMAALFARISEVTQKSA